ncbi:MAG: Stp1/IreP family PP2C-type Ser/Thr phosphatase [Bacilli bacterium]|jgi:protein phosphatase|nr:Stp1/IreP family PP2C-type Ser/Thr phosphatase [Bacilli bacterium]
MKKYAITNIGKVRKTNQDQAFVYSNTNNISIGIVCDGMGGHKAGGYASLLVSEIILREFTSINTFSSKDEAKLWMRDVINKANTEVRTKSMNEKYQGMGTTLVLTLVLEDVILIANIGDSRAYVMQNGTFKQISEDQTYVNILLREGKISKEEALNHPKKHVIMYAIGNLEIPHIDFYEIKRTKDTLIFMCSDGIYNLVTFKYLNTILESKLPVSQKAISIINDANDNGGYDNMSIVIMEGE